MKAESGAFSPQQAIVDAIKQVASEGAFVLYPSGHRDRLDVAVRRNVMTGIGQTTGEICLANARELDCDLMEITAHAGARPSHASWQGQIVSLSGKKGYLSLSDIGYGTGDGFKGWNCRHDWFPYFEGSNRMYSEKDLKELDAENIEFPDGSMHTLYEAEQYQRALERKIRETKRILAAQDEFFNNTSSESMKKAIKNNFDDFSIKLKRQEAQMNAFCEKTGLLVDNARVQKYGFGRSTAQKATSIHNSYLIDRDYNDIIYMKGRMSDVDVRKWYNVHDKKIYELIDKSKSLEEQARQAHSLRNQYKYQARELMKDQEKRKMLDAQYPLQDFDYYFNKYKTNSISEEEVYKRIIDSSMRPNKKVNQKLGLE